MRVCQGRHSSMHAQSAHLCTQSDVCHDYNTLHSGMTCYQKAMRGPLSVKFSEPVHQRAHTAQTHLPAPFIVDVASRLMMALNCCTSPVRLPVGLVQPRCCLLSVASFPLLHAFCTRDLSSAEAASSVVRWPSFRSSLAASGEMSMQSATTSGTTIFRWPIASCVFATGISSAHRRQQRAVQRCQGVAVVCRQHDFCPGLPEWLGSHVHAPPNHALCWGWVL